MNSNLRKVNRFSMFVVLLILPIVMWSSIGYAAAPETPYPDRPITVIQAWAPGASVDFATKLTGERISEFLGQPLVNVYKAGAGGVSGASFAAKAKPDGYTILSGAIGNLVFSPTTQKLDYTMDDFILMGNIGYSPLWVIAKADARWKTIKEFVEEAKKFPDKLLVATFGKMSTSDYVASSLNKYAGIKTTIVPYKSSGEVTTAVLGGHVDIAVTGSTGGAFEAGTVRMLANTGEERLPGDFSTIPTLKELGYPIIQISSATFAFPKGTPQPIVERFADAQKKAMQKYWKTIDEQLRKVDMWLPLTTSTAETTEQYKKAAERYRQWIAESGNTP